jgi:RNA processing factor Prp31
MIPFEEENFLSNYKELCKKLISENPNNFNKGLLQKPTKLHFSVIQLELNEDEELIKRVISVLDNIQEEIKNISEGNLTFNFEKFDVMDSIEKTRVVYAKMYEDENFKKLNNIIDLVIRSLINEGIIKDDKNSLDKYYINY